jgi:ribosomal protein L11 methyltransferase
VLSGDLARDVEERFDMVVANILSEVILLLLDQIPAVLKPKGVFICSGIIKENTSSIVEKMTSMGFEILDVKEMEDWTAIAGCL